jgi:3-hydroxyacyl-CoA dehydrogenase
VPEEQVFSYMIYYLAKCYGISPADAAKLKEIDFIQTLAFENLEWKRHKFFMELQNDRN